MRRSRRKTLLTLSLLGLALAGAFWWVTEPKPLEASVLPKHTPDVTNGMLLYNAAGCRSCHKPGPEFAGTVADLPLGGSPFKTPVGTFYPPNLTPDRDTGIGSMSDIDFVNVVQRGLSPEGEALAPALPYASYAHMKIEDVLDIKAYLDTLQPVVAPEKDADIPAAPLFRRGFALWKLIGFAPQTWQPDPSQSASWNRGSYLVNGPGHCGECHTPRNLLMVSKSDQAFAGGAHPGGEGKVPSLRDLIGRGRYKDAKDIASALQYGETMGYDKVSSGGMGEVQSNISKLPQSDIDAIGEYLASLK